MVNRSGLAVDFFAMANPENQYHQPVVLDLADEAVVPNTVFPELPHTRALQGFPNAARIVELRYPVMKELQDALGVLRVEFAQRPINPFG
jgi:hypothetical protein